MDEDHEQHRGRLRAALLAAGVNDGARSGGVISQRRLARAAGLSHQYVNSVMQPLDGTRGAYLQYEDLEKLAHGLRRFGHQISVQQLDRLMLEDLRHTSVPSGDALSEVLSRLPSVSDDGLLEVIRACSDQLAERRSDGDR